MPLLPVQEKQRQEPQSVQEGSDCGGHRVHRILQYETAEGAAGVHVPH